MPSRPDRPTAFVERTALAWERSAFAYASLAGLALGAAAHDRAPWLLGVAAALIAVAALVWRHAHTQRRIGEARPIALVAGATALTGVAAAVAALVAQ
jgi:uncharacterized membrane protein YidH (DUF202 family)